MTKAWLQGFIVGVMGKGVFSMSSNPYYNPFMDEDEQYKVKGFQEFKNGHDVGSSDHRGMEDVFKLAKE